MIPNNLVKIQAVCVLVIMLTMDSLMDGPRDRCKWWQLFSCRSAYGLKINLQIYVYDTDLHIKCTAMYPQETYLWSFNITPGHLFTERTDVLLQDLVKSQSCEIQV